MSTLNELLAPGRAGKERDGYLDLLGAGEDPTGSRPGQRLMASRVLPLIYERLWRPLGGRVLMGALGPGMAGERRIALEMLGSGAGGRGARRRLRAGELHARVRGRGRRRRHGRRARRVADDARAGGPRAAGGRRGVRPRRAPPTFRSATGASTRSAASRPST